MLQKIIDYLTGNRWVVRPCGWPYPNGYATFHPKKNTILDTGLTKEQARAECAELNKRRAGHV